MRTTIRLASALVAVLTMATGAMAQEEATITGVVTDQAGELLPGANVTIEGTNLGTLTNSEGRYLLRVPASRVGSQEVVLRASLIGRASANESLVLTPGAHTVDFRLGEDPLRLEEIIVTGQGTTRQREKVGVTVSSVSAEDVINSQESNIVAAMAGKAPNVKVTTSSGEPGGGSYINIRGANTIYGSTQPLFVVDGTPINNDSYSIESLTAGTATANRALDINPEDIESIEVLRGPAAGAIYGSRAASGVVLITTKQGRPGSNQWTYKQVVSMDEVNRTAPLQRSYEQGLDGTAFLGFSDEPVTIGETAWPSEKAYYFCYWFGACDLTAAEATAEANSLEGVDYGPTWPTSWGPRIGADTPTYDHASEIFRTGLKLEEDVTFSGGSDRTTYYLSLGRTDHTGVIDGNSNYDQTQARLRGSHSFTDNLTIGGNFMYTGAAGDMIQTGSNISGIMLGSLRTPPEFDNLPYLDPETGLHRSYRYPEPTELVRTRGYDNPFWVSNELLNTTDVARTIAQGEVSYEPVGWLNINYLFGVDYTNDERFSLFPKSTSDFPEGRMIRANISNTIFDSNLVLTANRVFNDDFAGTLTVGQNINYDRNKWFQVNGQQLIVGAEQLDYTVGQIPDESYAAVTTQGYFAQSNLDLYDQLFLTGTVRADAASTFGAGADSWFFYPQATAAWDFTQLAPIEAMDWLSFGKLRVAYGKTGRQPPVYSNITGFVTSTLSDGWLLPNGLRTIYQGREGVHSQAVVGNQSIRPETTTGIDFGLDLSFLENRINFTATYYNENTEDVIMNVPVAPSTGFASRWDNAAAIENEGLELTLSITPVRTDGFSWTLDGQWATNESCVTELPGSEFLSLGGFVGSLVGLYRPDTDEDGNVTRCYEYNTFYGDDWVRFGRGSSAGGFANIDEEFDGWSEGDVFIGADGFPVQDSRQWAYGNANPDWTGSLRSTFALGNNFRLSALFDASMGNQMWNGTKGALDYFGTSEHSERFHGAGGDTIFEGVGPGAGTEVTLNYINWFLGGPGSGFTGPFTQYIEDASYVKLRDISVSYSFAPTFLNQFGVTGAQLQLSGRNLYTWTDYEGMDPESNLWQQGAARGLDYFNIPRTRSYVISVSLNN